MRLLLFSSLFFCFLHSSLFAQKLSSDAQISLITGTAGDKLYTTFGHSAIRVYDPKLNLDILYNYGIFDSDTPNFIWKFVEGTLNYQLAIFYYDRMVALYQREGRSIYEQVLDLDQNQKQAIYDFLNENYKPENRSYRYDFYFDNCATRIRDLFENVLGEKLIWDFTGLPQELTYRDLMDTYLEQKHWLDFGLDLIVASPADKIAPPRDYMFLPSFLQEITGKVKIKTADGKSKSFVKETKTIYQAPPLEKSSTIFTPTFTTWCLFFLTGIATFLAFRRKKIWYWLDAMIFLLAGLAGSLFAFLGLISEHSILPYNWNILWAIPTHLIIIFLLFFHKKLRWLKYYYLLTGGIAILSVIFWFILPQNLPEALIPIFFLLVLRAGFVYWQTSQVISKNHS